MKKLGISPSSPYQEKPLYISSTGALIDEYVPPEGDGKASLISTTGAKQVEYLLSFDIHSFGHALLPNLTRVKKSRKKTCLPLPVPR